MNDQQLRQVYEAVDNIPFSRSKKNISRDFSDGVMMAQLVHHYNPKIVAMHNYPAANSTSKKINNWNTLNNKVLKKIGAPLTKSQIQDIVNCVPMAIQSYLYQVIIKFEAPEKQISIMHPHKQQAHMNFQQEKLMTPNAQNMKKQQQNLKNLNSVQGDEIMSLVQQIQDAYAQLQKLMQASKLRDQMIRNLQKKIDKMIFS